MLSKKLLVNSGNDITGGVYEFQLFPLLPLVINILF